MYVPSFRVALLTYLGQQCWQSRFDTRSAAAPDETLMTFLQSTHRLIAP